VKVLAIDTATENCSAALLVDGRVNVRERLLGRGHAEHILPMVDELLRDAQLHLAQLDAIAFGRGPGAFTGVRLAASVTQGLAFGAGLPVVPVSDLRALAQRAMTEAHCTHVLACLDARMQEVYWAAFEQRDLGLAQPVTEERVELPASVRAPPDWPTGPDHGGQPRISICGAGSGFASYAERLPMPSNWGGHVHAGLLPRAQDVLLLAVPEIEAGRLFPPEQALPLYLRDDVTQSPRAGH
jgi:tRNA threonylcarbamoyladenosine biosynthesis protein TsaB